MKIAKLPAINSSVCVKCHRCIDICPTKAIRVQHAPAHCSGFRIECLFAFQFEKEFRQASAGVEFEF